MVLPDSTHLVVQERLRQCFGGAMFPLLPRPFSLFVAALTGHYCRVLRTLLLLPWGVSLLLLQRAMGWDGVWGGQKLRKFAGGYFWVYALVRVVKRNWPHGSPTVEWGTHFRYVGHLSLC